jgi:hypothetical protein
MVRVRVDMTLTVVPTRSLVEARRASGLRDEDGPSLGTAFESEVILPLSVLAQLQRQRPQRRRDSAR